jgi:hypothetical protein
VANSKLLQLGRSPILVVVLAAFALLVASLPESGGSGTERVRQSVSWILAAGSALLCVTALLVPVVGGAPAARSREARLVGGRPANLAHAAAGLAFLVFLAGALALGSWLVILLRFGNPDGRFEGAVVRRVAWDNAAAIRVRPGEAWTSGKIAPGPHGGSILVEIRPRVRFLPASGAASLPSRPAGPPELELSWRADGGRTRTRRTPVATGRPIVEAIELGPGTRSLELGLASAARNVEVRLDAGSFSVLGTRAGCFAVVARALLVVACAASVLGIVAQWFSNFVSPLIAVAAALTLALVAVVAGAVSGWDPLPVDPVSAFRHGHDTAWTDVLRAAAAAAVAMLVGSAGAVWGREASS